MTPPTPARSTRFRTTPLRVIHRGREAERAWLAEHGFDGLACLADDCGCYANDLYPCGQRGEARVCVAGYESRDGSGIYRNVGAGDPI